MATTKHCLPGFCVPLMLLPWRLGHLLNKSRCHIFMQGLQRPCRAPLTLACWCSQDRGKCLLNPCPQKGDSHPHMYFHEASWCLKPIMDLLKTTVQKTLPSILWLCFLFFFWFKICYIWAWTWLKPIPIIMAPDMLRQQLSWIQPHSQIHNELQASLQDTGTWCVQKENKQQYRLSSTHKAPGMAEALLIFLTFHCTDMARFILCFSFSDKLCPQ